MEERKVKKGGQEKVEVADASMKGFARSALEDVLGPDWRVYQRAPDPET